MNDQLALKLRLNDSSSFANFYAGQNAQAVGHLETIAQGGTERALFLWGEAGSGKTHLLQAACRVAAEQGLHPVYLTFAEVVSLAVEVLENVEQALLVCLDDVGCIAGNSTWESAVFALCDRLRAAGGCLVGAARLPPPQLGLGLADLASRLGWGAVYPLHGLADEEKLAAVRLRARNRGLEMGQEVARYILNRYPRNMHSLFALLDRIDQASLSQQRRITIPFIRTLT